MHPHAQMWWTSQHCDRCPEDMIYSANLGLFIVSAHHFSKREKKKNAQETLKVALFMKLRAGGKSCLFNFSLQAGHHSSPVGANGYVHVHSVTVFCLLWKWHSWWGCVVRMTEEASSSVVCPSSFADIKPACSTLEKLHSVSKKRHSMFNSEKIHIC